MTRIRFTPRAVKELQAHVDWLDIRNPNAARRAAASVYDAIDQLREFPELGPEAGDVRRLIVGFGEAGFIVYYRLSGDVAVIESVLHGRQDRPSR